jgi:hypothetical protein
MVGATDPSIAMALEDQARALKMQAKTLDSTQKLLQRICERFDEQDVRWRELEHTRRLLTSGIIYITLSWC